MAGESLDLLRQEVALHREESRRYFGDLREDGRRYFETLQAETARSREESRQVTGTMLRALEGLVGRLDEMRLEMRAQREEWNEENRRSREESAALREGFLSVIDELKRHGLGGAPG